MSNFRTPNLSNALRDAYRFDDTFAYRVKTPMATSRPLSVIPKKYSNGDPDDDSNSTGTVDPEPPTYEFGPLVSTVRFIYNTTNIQANVVLSNMYCQFLKARCIDPSDHMAVDRSMPSFARFVASSRQSFHITLFEASLSNFPTAFQFPNLDLDREDSHYKGALPFHYICIGPQYAVINQPVPQGFQNPYETPVTRWSIFLVINTKDRLLPVQFYELSPDTYTIGQTHSTHVEGTFNVKDTRVVTQLPPGYDDVENAQLRLPLKVGNSDLSSALFDPGNRSTELSWTVTHDGVTNRSLTTTANTSECTDFTAPWTGTEYEGWRPREFSMYKFTTDPSEISKGEIYVEREALAADPLAGWQYTHNPLHCYCPHTGYPLQFKQDVNLPAF